MTDNEILARWQGYKFVYDSAEGNVFTPPNRSKSAWQPVSRLPDYPNDEAACGSLLDTLVEKGYYWDMYSGHEKGNHHVSFLVGHPRLRDYQHDFENDPNCFNSWKPTRREAIVAACLEVARKEVSNG